MGGNVEKLYDGFRMVKVC